MRADNYILINKVRGKYIGQMGFDSDDFLPRGKALSQVDSLEEAIKEANNIYTEYGVSYTRRVLGERIVATFNAGYEAGFQAAKDTVQEWYDPQPE